MRQTVLCQAYGAHGAGRRRDAMANAAFCGEVPQTAADDYLLGGRLYDARLRRFLNPDPVSPFGDGGIHRYAYCAGDPINRTDATGNAWRDWLGAPLAWIGTGAGATASQTGERWLPTHATPTAVSTTTLATRHTRPAGPPSTRPVTDTATGDLMGQATPNGNLVARRHDATVVSTGRGAALSRADRHRPSVHVKRGAAVPLERQEMRGATRTVSPQWESHPHPRKRDAVHWVVDSEVYSEHVGALMDALGRRAANPAMDGKIYIYSGAHGSATGDNWRDGVRRGGQSSFARQDSRNDLNYALVTGSDIEVIAIGGVTRRAMKGYMRRSGHHVHAYCFSVADHLVMKELNITSATVYEL